MVRQLITESLVLALIGGGLGVALAAGLLQVIMAMMPPYTLPSEADVQLNMPVLLFTLAACALSGILFGCAPAWQASRDRHERDAQGSGPIGRRRPALRLRRALVVVEFALALTLLAGGGLAIHGLVQLSRVNLGFRSDQLLTFSLPVPRRPPHRAEQIRRVLRRSCSSGSRPCPASTSASVSTGMPVRGTGFGMPFEIAGTPVADPSKRPGAGFNMVTPGYFRTFGIRITRGREFTEQDRAGGLPVAIVNQTFVTKYLPDVDPLTQRLLIEELIPGVTKLGPQVEWQIVGVYGDVRNAGPERRRLSRRSTCRSRRARGPARASPFAPPATRAASQQSLAAVVSLARCRPADGRREDDGADSWRSR